MSDQKKPKIPIAIYSPQSKNQIAAMTALQEYVLKKDEQFEIIFTESNAKESVDKITASGIGIILFDIPDKDHVVGVVNILSSLQNLVKKRAVKAIGFCHLKNPKLVTLLMKKGVTELLDPNIATRSLIYKFDKIIQIIETQLKSIQKTQANDVKKNSQQQQKTNSYVSAKIEWMATDNFLSDFWIIQKKSDVKRILGKWFIEVAGPPPVYGKWESIETQTQKNTVWKYVPRNAREPFYLNDGEWIFHGKIPEYSWESYTWKLTGDHCRLEFYMGNDCVTKRAGLDADTFKVKQNPGNTNDILAHIKKLMITELQTDLKKTKEGSPEYKQTEEKIKHAQGFQFLISSETQVGGPLGIFEHEEAKDSKINDKTQDPAESNLHNEVDKLFDRIIIDIALVLPDQAISTTGTLLDIDEEYLSLLANVPENIVGQNALIEISISADGKSLSFSLEGVIEESLLLDEDLNHSLDLKLKEINQDQLNVLRNLVSNRQELSTYFFHNAKGIE